MPPRLLWVNCNGNFLTLAGAFRLDLQCLTRQQLQRWTVIRLWQVSALPDLFLPVREVRQSAVPKRFRGTTIIFDDLQDAEAVFENHWDIRIIGDCSMDEQIGPDFPSLFNGLSAHGQSKIGSVD